MTQLTDDEFEQAKEYIVQMVEHDPRDAHIFLANLSEEELMRLGKAFERIEREDAEESGRFFRFLCDGLLGVDFLFI